MTITEWQEKFLQLVTEGKYNVFPPATIKALLAEEADYMKWAEMAEKFFSRYEGLTISVSGHNGAQHNYELTEGQLARRQLAYAAESDHLFLEWQYDKTPEAEQAWRDKVAEIKLRYPVSRGAEE